MRKVMNTLVELRARTPQWAAGARSARGSAPTELGDLPISGDS